MRDVKAVASRVAILKAGRKVFDTPLSDISADDLGRMILLAPA